MTKNMKVYGESGFMASWFLRGIADSRKLMAKYPGEITAHCERSIQKDIDRLVKHGWTVDEMEEELAESYQD